jgi:hypothetical protein
VFGLALATEHLLGVGQRRIGENLEGDAAAERLLLDLVDDANAAAADLTEDAAVAYASEARYFALCGQFWITVSPCRLRHHPSAPRT